MKKSTFTSHSQDLEFEGGYCKIRTNLQHMGIIYDSNLKKYFNFHNNEKSIGNERLIDLKQLVLQSENIIKKSNYELFNDKAILWVGLLINDDKTLIIMKLLYYDSLNQTD